VPDAARRLALRFWPGPLTMVLPARAHIPRIVTAGLPTVAVRCPSHPVALEILRAAGVPLAAPSANRSGSPSPTEPKHVKDDLDGRIDAIVAAGPCPVGLESTIVDLSGGVPRLLRPGAVTREQLLTVLDGLEEPGYDPAQPPPSPGLKYRHYAPVTPLVLLRGDAEKRANYLRNWPGSYAVLCYEGEQERFGEHAAAWARPDDPETAARKLYGLLRRLDTTGAETLYAVYPEGDGLWEAVRNRLLKASGASVIPL
jgi:L-threonylcarbamoyladenylate synthase